MPEGSREFDVARVRGGEMADEKDVLAVEEPLEIRLAYRSGGRPVERSVSITMRTPGDDFDLVAGFLFGEGILRSPEQVASMVHCGRAGNGARTDNVVRVELRDDATVDLQKLERHFYTTSSCGVCGKTSLEALRATVPGPIEPGTPRVRAEIVASLPAALSREQALFGTTGGLHASALFDAEGSLLGLREDVGRHNALDKLCGHFFRRGALPLRQSIVMLSGRASFELLQKAVMAGVPVVVAVGAPSTLAVELAREHGVTLIGFVRDGRFNAYSGRERILP